MQHLEMLNLKKLLLLRFSMTLLILHDLIRKNSLGTSDPGVESHQKDPGYQDSDFPWGRIRSTFSRPQYSLAGFNLSERCCLDRSLERKSFSLT
jgi:hypothetical protein